MVGPSDILNASVLIVDDQDDNVVLLKRTLEGAGYTSVTSTRDPLEVCELHRTHRYDLILLDLQMPGMDGFQVIEGLKGIETEGYVPVLVLTAQPSHKLRALEAGAKDFISKPFDPAEVLARVYNMLEVRLLHVETENYSKSLERMVREVEASHEQIRRQSDEVTRLYDEIVAEQKRSLELSAQPGAMVGVEKEERLATPWFRSLRLRHPWLQLNLLTAFAAGGVVFVFQGIIDRVVILAMFLPVLAGQSGNTGCQTLAITLRGVFLGELKSGKEKALIMKEALLGLLNGALVGLVAAFVMYVVATAQHFSSALVLSAVVFLAMTGSCVISGICGALVPLALKKLGADPATASSILLTTATDMVSVGMLLGLATVLVK
ncbi:MAG TPA: response regulator [Burkholderiales bacterium]|nr:response regulator [Burkholderiales bacterium]